MAAFGSGGDVACGEKEPARAAQVCAALGLALVTASVSVMNATLFPLLGQTFGFSRDIASFAAVAAYALTALLVIRRPSALRHRMAFFVAALALWFAGLAAALAASAQGSVAALVVGESASLAGSAWLQLLVMLAVSTALRGRGLLVGVPCALALGEGAAALVAQLPPAAALGLYAALPPLAAALTLGVARQALAGISQAPAEAELSLAWPSSYLSPFNRLYLCIVVFSIATGFALRFGVQEGRADTAVFAVLALLAAAPCCLLSHSAERFDTLFRLSVLFTMGGFLLTPVASAALGAKSALGVGNALYQFVATLVILALAQRNRVAGLTVLAWGLCWQSVGIPIGANIGALAHSGLNPDVFFCAGAAMGVALLAFVLFGLRGFSFDETIAGVTPVQPLVVPPAASPLDYDQACERLAARCALTARETDVLRLLARGRNNSYIQEELSLSRNTVKSHVRHVYTKLDVHSQQELIDLVDDGG